MQSSPALERILLLVMELTAAERAQLIDALDTDEHLTPADWEAAWVDECERRMADLEAGRTKLVSHEEFLSRWKERYG